MVTHIVACNQRAGGKTVARACAVVPHNGRDLAEVQGRYAQAAIKTQAASLGRSLVVDHGACVGAHPVAGKKRCRSHRNGANFGIFNIGLDADGRPHRRRQAHALIGQNLTAATCGDLALMQLSQREQTGHGHTQASVRAEQGRGRRLVDVLDIPSDQVECHGLTRQAIALRARRAATGQGCEGGLRTGRDREVTSHHHFGLQHPGHDLPAQLVPGQRALEIAKRRNQQRVHGNLRRTHVGHCNQVLEGQHLKVSASDLTVLHTGLHRALEALACDEQGGQPAGDDRRIGDKAVADGSVLGRIQCNDRCALGGLNLGIEQQGTHAAARLGAQVLAQGAVGCLRQCVDAQRRRTQVQGLDLRQHGVADLQVNPAGQARGHLRERTTGRALGRDCRHLHLTRGAQDAALLGFHRRVRIGHGDVLAFESRLDVACDVQTHGSLPKSIGQIDRTIVGRHRGRKGTAVQCLDQQRMGRCARLRPQHQRSAGIHTGLGRLVGDERDRSQPLHARRLQRVGRRRTHCKRPGCDDGLAANPGLGRALESQVHGGTLARTGGTQLRCGKCVKHHRTAGLDDAVNAHVGAELATDVDTGSLFQQVMTAQEVVALPFQGLTLLETDRFGLDHHIDATEVEIFQQDLVHTRAATQTHQLGWGRKKEVVDALTTESQHAFGRRG